MKSAISGEIGSEQKQGLDAHKKEHKNVELTIQNVGLMSFNRQKYEVKQQEMEGYGLKHGDKKHRGLWPYQGLWRLRSNAYKSALARKLIIKTSKNLMLGRICVLMHYQ